MGTQLRIYFCVILIVWGANGEYNMRIGGLFHTGSEDNVAMFNYVVGEANEEALDEAHRLEPVSEMVPKMNAFHVGRAVCNLLETGVAAIIGPDSSMTAPHVQSVCDAKEVPHLETRWDYPQHRGGCSVNLHPYPPTFYRAIIDLIHAWGWTEFAILYEKEAALSAMSEILEVANEKQYSIMLRHLGREDNYRDILRQVQTSGCRNIIVDCSLGILPEVMIQAQQVGLVVAEYNYIISNLDFHTLDLDFLMHAGTNITGIRMIHPLSKHPTNPTDKPMLLETALIYDAVGVFTVAWKSMSEANISTIHPLNCSAVDSWAHGYTLINLIKTNEVPGYTKLIKFDHEGFRSQFELDLFEVFDNGLVGIGTWNSTDGLNITRANIHPVVAEDDRSVANRSFIVSIAMADPYGMTKESQVQLYGNDRFEGFAVDVFKALSAKLGFNYTFVVQEDGVYGSLNKQTNEWNGMLREIMDGRVDLGICDLTITHERESAVDFTTPFMNLGISILYKKPQKEAPSLFSFMAPFSNEVWMCMLAAYIGVSVLLFVMARISPYEWTNPYPCIEEPDELENQFSLKNSLWFTIGSLMQQGSEIAPIAVSTRMVAGIWWFFTLIMVSSYTANLAAFLTVESPVEHFTDDRSLAYNTLDIKYGAKKGGSTFTFFRDSKKEVHQRMYKFMMDNPSVMVSTNEEGRTRCENEKYAYLMESTSIEYITERFCNLTQVNGLLDSKGYGIAMRKNASYRSVLSSGVVFLQEQGTLTELKRKWWKEKRGGGACDVTDAGSNASELSLNNVGGVFVVLVGGIFIAFFITVFEMLCNIIESIKEYKTSFKEELIEELRFISKCHGSTKPVRNRVSEDSEEEDEYKPIPIITSNFGWFDNNGEKS